MTVREDLNNLSKGDEVILEDIDGNTFEVEFLEGATKRRRDPVAKRQQYDQWFMQDESGRLYEVDNMSGDPEEVEFDRNGKNGSFQAEDAIAKRFIESVEEV